LQCFDAVDYTKTAIVASVTGSVGLVIFFCIILLIRWTFSRWLSQSFSPVL